MKSRKLYLVLIFTSLIVACNNKPVPQNQTKSPQPISVIAKPADPIPVVNSAPKPLPPLPKTPTEIFEEADYLAYVIIEIVEKPSPDDKDAKPIYRKSLGSGVVMQYKDEWYVLTAGHLDPLIGEVDHAWVRLKQPELSKKLLEVEFVATDRFMDIALLKFKEKFAYTGKKIVLGRSDHLKTGETVIALGAPYAIPECMSVGKIIKPMFGMAEGANHPGLILHDASFNGGNSGGPLLNIDGELIGINIRVKNLSPGYTTSNTVPIDDIKPIIPVFLAMKMAPIHPLVFVQVQDSWNMTPGWCDRAGIDFPKLPGLVITLIPNVFAKIYEEFKLGDVILEVDGKKITNASGFYHDTMTNIDLPDSVELLIQRKDKTLKLKAPLLPYPE